MHAVLGGMSAVFKWLLHQFVVPLENFISGVVLYTSDGPKMFFAQISNVLGDLPAIAATFGFKGHAGLKPCPLCANVVNAGYLTDESKRIADPSGILVEISCFDPTKFVTSSDNDLYGAVDSLSRARGNIRAESFAALERSVGINFNPHGVLSCSTLRPMLSPTTMISFDWDHMYSREAMRFESHISQHPLTHPPTHIHQKTLKCQFSGVRGRQSMCVACEP